MPIFTQNFTLDQSADFAFSTPPYVLAGVTQTFAGASARMMLRQSPNDGAPILSSAAGQIVLSLGGAAGTATFTIPKASTALLTGGTAYQYDLFVDLPGGTSVRLLYGTMVVAPSITH